MYGTLISTQTLTGTAASVTFSAIPGTYTDLVLVVSSRLNITGYRFALSCNGSTTPSAQMVLEGSGSSASSNTVTTNNNGYAESSSYTASTFSNNIFYFPNYASSTTKVYSIDGVSENNATAAMSGIIAGSFGITTAITSLKLDVSGTGGSMVAGTTMSLYGLTHF